MKLHGKDKLMILNLQDHTSFHLPNVYRVIDNGINNSFVAKIWDPKKFLYKNRRFDKSMYSYSIEKDTEWKPSTVRRNNAGV